MRKSLALTLLSLFTGAALAHGNSVAVLMVSAEVRHSAALRFEANTSQLTITLADIAYGYLEIPADAFFRLSAGRFTPGLFLDSTELRVEGGAYRLDLSGWLTPGARPAPLTLRIEL